jgi:ferritin-like metal-binding protein YciE
MEKNQDARSLMREYLIDAVAAENNSESQLIAMSKMGDHAPMKRAFCDHAEETKQHVRRLTQRLEEIGGSPSTFKSFIAHVMNFGPKIAQFGHDSAEHNTQNLIIAYTLESAEFAMYEALATAADVAGDLQTAELAREIQKQEEQAAKRFWHMIAPVARAGMIRLSDAQERNPNLTPT